MASNTQLNVGTSGDVITTKERTHDDDATKQQGVFISGVKGTEGAYTWTDIQAGDGLAANALRVTVAGDSHGVGQKDTFGRLVTASADNDVEVSFYKGTPSTLVTVTTANGGTAASNVGGALFSAGTNTSGSVVATTSPRVTKYRAGSEMYCLFTAAFSAGIASAVQRIGLFDSASGNGFWLGYEGTTFGFTVCNNGSPTQTAQANWNLDTLTSATTSKFTRAGNIESVNLTYLQVWRIRFGWLGSAPIVLEILSPDGIWVPVHIIRQPNLSASPSIRNPDLPVRIEVTKTSAGATDISIQTDCWAAGTVGGIRNAQEDEVAFVTTTPLTSSSTYNSGVLSLSPEFSQVQTTMLADVDGTLDAYWYSDAAGTDQIRTLQIPYTASRGFEFFAAPAFGPFVKYIFTNGGTGQSDFYFSTVFLRRPISPQILRVDGTVANGMTAQLTRSLISAYNGTSYTNITATTGGNLKVAVEEFDTALPSGTNNIGDVDVLTVPAPLSTTGGGTEATALRVTLASDSTGVVSVDDNGTTLSIDDGGGIITVDGTVNAAQSGTWTVQPGNTANTTAWLVTGTGGTFPATQSGTWVLGANSGVDIGDVTINNAAGASAVNIQDGGNSITVDGTVSISGTVTVDSELPTAAALADNTANPTVPGVGAFGLVWDGATWDRQPGTSTDGTLVNLGTNNDVTVTGTVTVDTELPTAAALADNTANPTLPSVGAFNMVYDGATWDRAPGTSADGLLVNLGGNNDVTITSGAVTATLAAGTNTNEVVGDVAHDIAAAGNPVLIAGRATNNIEGLTQVQAADSSYITTDLNGCLVVRPHTTLEEIVQTTQSVTTTASTPATNFGAVANIRNFITSVTIWNSSAVDTFVRLQDGSGGADLAVLPAPQAGGSHITFPVPLRTTANTALHFAEGATASTIYVTIVGFQARG